MVRINGIFFPVDIGISRQGYLIITNLNPRQEISLDLAVQKPDIASRLIADLNRMSAVFSGFPEASLDCRRSKGMAKTWRGHKPSR